MLILTLRTDKPEAEVGLFNDAKEVVYETWHAHRELAETLHTKVRTVLKEQNLELENIQGIVVYKGPGSFTGLRIGISVANALADAYRVPIIGKGTEDWLDLGIKSLVTGQNDRIVVPEYGMPPNITTPKH